MSDTWKEELTWTLNKIPDLNGKVFIVTGGNCGIGYEVTKHLAKNNAHVIIAGRPTGDIPTPDEAIRQIRQQYPNAKIEFMPLELSSFKSIKKFADDFKSRGLPLHCLINNAGIQTPPDARTEDGFEWIMQVNHLGPFYLTELLLDSLKSSPPSRIVWVSSAEESIGEIHWENLRENRGQTDMKQYASTKLMNLMAAKEFNERLKGTGVESFACHPGMARTDLFREGKADHSKLASVITDWASWVAGQSAESGAMAVLFTATAPELTGKGGHFYGAYYKGPWCPNIFNTSERQPGNKYANDPAACQRLFDECDKIVKEVERTRIQTTAA